VTVGLLFFGAATDTIYR